MSNPSEPAVINHLTVTAPPTLTASAVSWGAILAGAAGAAALSLILLILGAGLGLSSVSPWLGAGITAATFGVSTILWVTLTQVGAAAMGGYLAGRLRARWVGVPMDEVHFRDTAHGFLAWAVASLATATLLTSVIGSIVNGGIQVGASVAGEQAAASAMAATAGRATPAVSGSDNARPNGDSGILSYFVDSLFRRDPGETMTATARTVSGTLSGGIAEPASAAFRSEVNRIFTHAIRTDTLPAQDARYVGQLVARHTHLNQEDAEKRVTDTYARVQAALQEADATTRTAVDAARKATAYASLWLVVSLLSGAFVASLTATFGGRQRDL